MRELWLYTKDFEKEKSLILKALESGYTGVVSNSPQKVKELGKITVIGPNGDIKLMSEVPSSRDGRSAVMIDINSKEDEMRAREVGGKTDYLIVECKNWKVIPLENLIASLQNSKTLIIASVSGSDEARTALETLEVGVGGVMLKTNNINEVIKTADAVRQVDQGKIKLVPAEVIGVTQVDMGDRVCIDTCNMMEVGEGMLIGSQSTGLFLVHAEVSDSPYVNARPFRVNAGAVHSYIFTQERKTNYLCELKAGDGVLIVKKDGKTRNGVVGRVKIERRPLMLIEAKHDKNIYKIILQNAETIKLLSGEGVPVSVTSLKAGDQVLVAPLEGARHFGMNIEETVVER